MVSLEDRVRLDVFQNRVENLSNVIIPSYLNQLDEQKKNIRHYQQEEEWDIMTREQRNAARTIKQLKTHVVELEDVKDAVNDEGLEELNTIIAPLQQQILTAVTSFQELEQLSTSDEGDFVVLPTTESFVATATMWRELQDELQELHLLNEALMEQVQVQTNQVEDLENLVNETGDHVRLGILDYASIATLRANAMPIGGAIIGGVVGTMLGGPIGFLAGAKVGTVTTIAGGAAGAVGGTYLGIQRGKAMEETSQQLTAIAHQKVE